MTADEFPPALANPEAEAAFLGCALIENEVADRAIDKIRPEDFYLPLHGRIWAAIVRERNLGRYVNPTTIRGYFEDDPDIALLGGIRYLAELTANPAATLAAKELIEGIRDLAQRRAIRQGLLYAAAQCENLSESVEEVTSAADAVLALQAEQQADVADLSDCMTGLLESLDKPLVGVTCGSIPDFDETVGALYPGSMTVIAGRPAMGKTAVALNYARAAMEKGHGVLFLSLEMSGEELSARVISEMSFDYIDDRVPFSLIRDRKVGQRHRVMMLKAQNYMAAKPFKVLALGSVRIGRIRAVVRSVKRKMAAAGHKLDLVVIDYLQLVEPDEHKRSLVEAVSAVSRGIKAIAMDEQIAIIALAQLSRAIEQRQDKRPVLSDLRESGQIEQDADAVIGVFRPEYYIAAEKPEDGDPDKFAAWEDKMDRAKGVIEFLVRKRRNGPTGSVEARFFGAYQAVRQR